MVNVDLSVVGAILNETGRLKTSIPIDNMMLLGAYRFCINAGERRMSIRRAAMRAGGLTEPLLCTATGRVRHIKVCQL